MFRLCKCRNDGIISVVDDVVPVGEPVLVHHVVGGDEVGILCVFGIGFGKRGEACRQQFVNGCAGFELRRDG
ncbi:hypothetical protein D3C87_2059180 [compost metagenome]